MKIHNFRDYQNDIYNYLCESESGVSGRPNNKIVNCENLCNKLF